MVQATYVKMPKQMHFLQMHMDTSLRWRVRFKLQETRQQLFKVHVSLPNFL